MHMNTILHRAPVTDQAHPVLPATDPAEGRIPAPVLPAFSREELRLIILDVMG